ncbi:MAG: response regulator transcription factor [Nitrospirota bacterium]|jgi:DNA-binding response OmpR family regulator
MSRINPQEAILIVEDDRNTASLVATYLEREGFATLIAYDGKQGLELARRHRPIFVILDLMLPKLDGREVCRTLRSFSEVPVLMLTARGDEVDRIVGFSLGADDYVAKPFSPRELLERVKAILRRTRGASPARQTVLSCDGLVLDTERHTVTRNGRPVALTPSEYKLLQTLMTRPGRVFSRDELLDHINGPGDVVVDRVIDVHIGKLRRKIEPDPSTPQYISTVRGIGYRLAEAIGA